MSSVSGKAGQRYCFVIMGFGVKTDFETGRTIDLDKAYRNIIKPSVEAAGLECIRADEVIHSGNINQPMFNRLLEADVVIADLSTANTRALYELGVRHALRPYTTIVIAEERFWAVPFDIANVAVRRYKHLGEDIGFGEVTRFRKELTSAITAALETMPPPVDSPVYLYLPELKPPSLNASRPGETTSVPPKGGSLPSSTQELLDTANDAQRRGDFLTAKRLFTFIRETLPPQPPGSPGHNYYVQKIALVTYKSKYPSELGALEEARDLLWTIQPTVSLDPETINLWGAVNKRLWDVKQEPPYLDAAVDSYERGFCLTRDYYNGINQAFLLNVRSAHSASRPDAIADFVRAARIRRQVITVCEEFLRDGRVTEDQRYWVMATMAEAYLGIGDEKMSQEMLKRSSPPSEWMKASVEEQLAKLRLLLEKSPLGSLGLGS